MMMWHDVLQFPFSSFISLFCCALVYFGFVFFMCQQNEKQNADHFDNNISFSFLLFNEPTYVSIIRTKIFCCYYDVSVAQVLSVNLWFWQFYEQKIFPFLLQTLLAVRLMSKHKIVVINSLQPDYYRRDYAFLLRVLLQRSVKHLGFNFGEYFFGKMMTNYHINCSCVQ